jgi:hypothetical protein
VTAIGRARANFSAAEQAGAAVIAGDATDAALMNSVVREEAPDVLILNAGTRLPIKPIDQQNWAEFSIVWNTDVKAGLVVSESPAKVEASARIDKHWHGNGLLKSAMYENIITAFLTGEINAERLASEVRHFQRKIDPITTTVAVSTMTSESAITSTARRLPPNSYRER